MSNLVLPFLETMITQVCNLSCKGCTNYSDQKHSGYVTWAQGRAQIESWLDRIDIPDFGIIGGEPLINPELDQWILGLRDLMPESQLRLTTNGLLLHKWPQLMDLINHVGNCVFKVTVHVDDAALEQEITKIFHSQPWEPVIEYGIARWRNTHGVRLQINRPLTFLKTYLGTYNNMAPHHSKPADAFAACVQKTCPLLYQGKIYKCSTSALLLDTLDRYGRPNWPQWEPYIEQGISPESPLEQLTEFVNNFGNPHPQCSQCPTSTIIPLTHITSVKRK
jgi:sulfatase maturation enzyme AslB (radical SAM superfamily)